MSTPKSDPCSATLRLLTNPEVAKVIWRALRAKGIRRKADAEEARQEVYLRALRFFRANPGPTELEHMKAFCARVAMNYAFDQARKAKRRKQDLEAHCGREEYGFVEPESGPRRDAVDAARQVEVLVALFGEGRMPEHGVEILEGVAWKCSYVEIGEELGIHEELVRWRLREMRRIFRTRMAKLGLLPGMKPLHVVIRDPSAIPLVRRVA